MSCRKNRKYTSISSMVIINTNIESISNYPFDRLRNLLGTSKINKDLVSIDFSIGQPYQKVPEFIKETILNSFEKWHLYPPLGGISELKNAYLEWTKRRFKLPYSLSEENILPLAGTKEGLFSIALALAYDNIVIPNPFYQVYLAPSIIKKVNICYLNISEKFEYLYDLEELSKLVSSKKSLVYFCSPSNPNGKSASYSYLDKLIKIIRNSGSFLLIDECYVDLYNSKEPVGALKVSCDSAEKLNNVLVFHSLSKRSNVAGLRSGFVSGDKRVISLFRKLRTYSAPTIPIPLQLASASLWSDDLHVEQNRILYKEKFEYANNRLENYKHYKTTDAGFYLWLHVKDGEYFTKNLYEKYGIKVMPGKYLAYGSFNNPGENYVRIALVHDFDKCKFAIDKISELLGV